MLPPATLRIAHPVPGVTALWLDRPARRNALDGTLTAGLLEVFASPPPGAIVLGSSDPRCFCGGADLSMGEDERAGVSDDLYELYERMTGASTPIVAAVQGAAVGGGAQLALASDLRVGAANATFRFAGPGHGLAVGSWGLPSLVGRGRAMDLCLTMRTVGAQEALHMGLLDRIEEDPRAAAVDLAQSLTALDAQAVGRVKENVREASALSEGLRRERSGNRDAWSGSIEGLTREDGRRS